MSDVITDQNVDGVYEEKATLEFADGSKLRVELKISGGERAFLSSAGRFANRVRAVLNQTPPRTLTPEDEPS